MSSSPTRQIQLTHGKSAIVDATDYELLITFKWRAVRIHRTWYAHTYVPGGAQEFMHRLIMCVGPQQMVDHCNGNGLDNRRANLRLTTCTLNQGNRRSVRSKSGFKGVSFDRTRKSKPFRAHITVDGVFTFLGAFGTAEQAAYAYDEAAYRYFGEHAATNKDLGLLP